jgi:hypothetical protein
MATAAGRVEGAAPCLDGSNAPRPGKPRGQSVLCSHSSRAPEESARASSASKSGSGRPSYRLGWKAIFKTSRKAGHFCELSSARYGGVQHFAGELTFRHDADAFFRRALLGKGGFMVSRYPPLSKSYWPVQLLPIFPLQLPNTDLIIPPSGNRLIPGASRPILRSQP